MGWRQTVHRIILAGVSESNTIKTILTGFVIVLLLLSVMQANALELQPYKDRLFSYPGILQPDGDDSYVIVDYRESRDIDQRDQVPERRVWGRYVSLKVRKAQTEQQLETPAGGLKHFVVGEPRTARVIVIYVHGKGGNRKQGINDFSFGGNFNRLKNLMTRNGGLYISPDVPSFSQNGAIAVSALIAHYRKIAGRVPVILACGSLGAEICYQIAGNSGASAMVSGYILLGAPPVAGIVSSPAFSRTTPFLFAHGSRDSVYAIDSIEAHFRRFKAKKADYPARFVRFETGSHGTPIRMVDWRKEINWMLSVQ